MSRPPGKEQVRCPHPDSRHNIQPGQTAGVPEDRTGVRREAAALIKPPDRKQLHRVLIDLVVCRSLTVTEDCAALLLSGWMSQCDRKHHCRVLTSCLNSRIKRIIDFRRKVTDMHPPREASCPPLPAERSRTC